MRMAGASDTQMEGQVGGSHKADPAWADPPTRPIPLGPIPLGPIPLGPIPLR